MLFTTFQHLLEHVGDESIVCQLHRDARKTTELSVNHLEEKKNVFEFVRKS